jgi:metal-dependent HD superfamily phosphatase/phosphodiesterase
MNQPTSTPQTSRTDATFELPVRGNRKLAALVRAINADAELRQLWRCANINAVERSGISDHGEIHIRIVANAALRLLRLLMDGGVEPSVVTHHGLTGDDAEVIVALAAALHDVGIGVHREHHESHSLILAYPKARSLLASIYEEPDLTVLTMEVLHAVIAHRAGTRCLTVEAGALKVADALDMTVGRSRIPFEAGQVNIHSVSAQAIRDVKIVAGKNRPVELQIFMEESAGIFQIDDLLKKKLTNSSLASHVEVVAHIHGAEGETTEYYRL